MLRRIYRFENRSGSDFVTFPLIEPRQVSGQQIRSGLFDAAGQDYPIRLLGAAPGRKAVGREQVVFVLASKQHCPGVIDGKWDTLVNKLYTFGEGKLWSQDSTEDDKRWAYAFLAGELPVREVDFARNRRHLETGVEFSRLSDWYGETVTGSEVITETPHSWTLNNPGLQRAGNLIIRLRANSTAGFDNNPTLLNALGPQEITINKEAAMAVSEIRIRPSVGVVEYSDNDGVSYGNVYDLVTLGSTQTVLFELLPGDNPITYMQDSGTPDLTIEWEFSPAWVTP